MKKFFSTRTFSYLTALVVIVCISSCKREIKSFRCPNGATYSGGQCFCPTGYEGLNCDIMTRTRYLGTWTVTDSGSTSAPLRYPISIVAANPSPYQISFINFDNSFTEPVTANINGNEIYASGLLVMGKRIFIRGSYDLKTQKITLAYMYNDVNGSGLSVNHGYSPDQTKPVILGQ